MKKSVLASMVIMLSANVSVAAEECNIPPFLEVGKIYEIDGEKGLDEGWELLEINAESCWVHIKPVPNPELIKGLAEAGISSEETQETPLSIDMLGFTKDSKWINLNAVKGIAPK